MFITVFLHRTQLSAVFNVVKLVDVLDSQDADNLALLARPELGITFTKLHCWRLTEFDKCVFLDADTLVTLETLEHFIETTANLTSINELYSK